MLKSSIVKTTPTVSAVSIREHHEDRQRRDDDTIFDQRISGLVA
jgi:hypothetical protein